MRNASKCIAIRKSQSIDLSNDNFSLHVSFRRKAL